MPRRRQSIYLLPNLFTTACVFSGFYAIVMAINGQFSHAAVAIFVAMVLDSLDGRVARLTNTTSDFGANYDSLYDMVSFGVAPAIVGYVWALKDMGKLGWVAAFVYLAGAALRLARFNTNIGVVDKRFFQGLPSPAAAALVAGLVWLVTDWAPQGLVNLDPVTLGWIVWVLMVYAGGHHGEQRSFLQLQRAELTAKCSLCLCCFGRTGACGGLARPPFHPLHPGASLFSVGLCLFCVV